MSPPLRFATDTDLERWAASTTPLTVLVPEFDDFLRPEAADRRFARVPHAHVVPVNGAKHLWVGERFVQRVLDEVVALVRPELGPLPRSWDGPMERANVAP